MRRSHKTKTARIITRRKAPVSPSATLPFIEHFHELRRRLVYIAISVIAWSAVAYAVEQRIIAVLLRPAHGQNFIYTSPIDGINFLFKLCLYVGIALSIPVIVYHFLRFIEPLMRRSSLRFIRCSTCVSALLAFVGMIFGYFAGLPTALYFLLHQFVSRQVHPLLTIDAYLSFVLVYMLGSALVFQVPLIIVCINRIKPLTPGGLFKKERWAIIFAFVLGFIMNPTPNILDQLFVVCPIIASYQLGIGMIWLQNRTPKKSVRLRTLREKDMKLQSERMRTQELIQPLWRIAAATETVPVPVAAPPQAAATRAIQAGRRPRQYVDGFIATAPQRSVPGAV